MKCVIRLNIILFLTVILSCLKVSAEEIPVQLHLNLKQTLLMAKERSAQVIMANERVQQSLARIGQSRSTLFPQLTASASEKRQTRDLRSAGISLGNSDPLVGPFNSYDARIKLTQTLFDAAAMERLSTMHHAHDLTSAQYKKIQQDTLAFVASLFIEAKRSFQTLKVARSFIKRDMKHLNVVRSQSRLGLSSSLELTKAQADYKRSVYLWHTAVKEAHERRLDLGAALGIEKDVIIIFEEDDHNWILPNEILTRLDEVPDIRIAEEELKASQSLRSVEKKEYWPKVSAMADYGPSGVSPSDANETYTLGVMASVPIWEGGLRSSRIKETQSQVKEKEINLKDVQRRQEANVLSAIETIKQAKAFVRQRESELKVAHEQIKIAQQRLGSGIGSDLELADSLAQQLSANDQKEDAAATYLMAQINLAHALGRIDYFLNTKESEGVSRAK